MINQPKWKCVAQLGDMHPVEHGGFFVLVDKTGTYSPEAEILQVDECDDQVFYTVYRFLLDKCTYINGVLSDNQYHPDQSAWFAKSESEKETRPQDTTYLSSLCDCMGVTMGDMIANLCSGDPIDRAIAYREIAEYHGYDNFDSYPLNLTRSEARKRYSRAMYKIK